MTGLPVLTERGDAYECPLDGQLISHSLHVARLSVGHPGCRDCRHNQQTGSLPTAVVKKSRALQHRRFESLVTAEGLRGICVNQLTRTGMATLVSQILTFIDRTQNNPESGLASHRGGPLRVLTGYDSRLASPDLSIGVVSALKTGGCDIADVGQATRPAFDFAFDRSRPDVGLYVTGGSAPSTWNGLDILDEDKRPWCAPGKLSELELELDRPAARLSRTPGRYSPLNITAQYEAELAAQFHALRPLRLAIACGDESLRHLIQQLLQETPCSPHFVQGGWSSGDAGKERGRRLLIDTLCEKRLDLGLQIGRDARSCVVFDEGGHELAVRETLALLAQLQPDSRPLLLSGAEEDARGQATEIQYVAGTEADLIAAQTSLKVAVAADREHRFWFLSGTSDCDALLTMARLLEALSLSERPVSTYRLPSRSRSLNSVPAPLSSSSGRSPERAGDPASSSFR